MIRVAIVDDHAIVRTGLRQFLSEQTDLRVTGEASNGREALDIVRQGEVDVILMDLSMPVLNGLDATRLLREVVPSMAIVIFSAFESADLKRQAYDAGAVAFLPKGCSNERLRATLEAAVTVAGSNLRRA